MAAADDKGLYGTAKIVAESDFLGYILSGCNASDADGEARNLCSCIGMGEVPGRSTHRSQLPRIAKQRRKPGYS